jgi:hypothetical protein
METGIEDSPTALPKINSVFSDEFPRRANILSRSDEPHAYLFDD